MALKNAEVCPGCKQFNLMCMCSSQKVDNPNSTEATLLRRQGSVTLHSLAIYKSTLNRQSFRRQSCKKSPKNQPVLDRKPSVRKSPVIEKQSNIVQEAADPEVIKVSKTKPVPIETKRRVILRLVEAVYEETDVEEKAEVPTRGQTLFEKGQFFSDLI